MIIQNDVSFDWRARFLRDSLCGIPEGSRFRAALAQHPAGAGEGFRAVDDLLRELYSDAAHIEGEDDEARYANLIATMWFLYAVA